MQKKWSLLNRNLNDCKLYRYRFLNWRINMTNINYKSCLTCVKKNHANLMVYFFEFNTKNVQRTVTNKIKY